MTTLLAIFAAAQRNAQSDDPALWEDTMPALRGIGLELVDRHPPRPTDLALVRFYRGCVPTDAIKRAVVAKAATLGATLFIAPEQESNFATFLACSAGNSAAEERAAKILDDVEMDAVLSSIAARRVEVSNARAAAERLSWDRSAVAEVLALSDLHLARREARSFRTGRDRRLGRRPRDVPAEHPKDVVAKGSSFLIGAGLQLGA